MALRIVTDSTADLDADEAERLGIAIVPLTVFFGDEALLDRVEITPQRFYERLQRTKVLPRTSQPSVGRFQETYARLAAEGATEILVITISSKLSGTLGAARLAASEPPAGCTITLLDSMTVAGGLGILARRAAEVAAVGGTAADGEALAEKLIPRHHISIVLDTLEYLQRGGRIGRARALLGSVLNIKPIVRVKDGEVGAAERVRSRGRGIERIFELTLSVPNLERVIIQHTGSPEDAAALGQRLQQALPGVELETRWIGPVVGVYVGPNGLGTVAVERVAGAGSAS
jgi:DegV family protein with EDD domain